MLLLGSFALEGGLAGYGTFGAEAAGAGSCVLRVLAAGLGVGELLAQGLELLLFGAEAGLADGCRLGNQIITHREDFMRRQSNVISVQRRDQVRIAVELS